MKVLELRAGNELIQSTALKPASCTPTFDGKQSLLPLNTPLRISTVLSCLFLRNERLRKSL